MAIKKKTKVILFIVLVVILLLLGVAYFSASETVLQNIGNLASPVSSGGVGHS